MKKYIFTALAIAAVMASGCKEKASEKFENELATIQETAQIPALSVAVVVDNKIVYSNEFGVKDLETQEPVTKEDIYRIASISKSFTATSMMQLVEQGKVTLDTDVSELAGFTIRNPKFPETIITLDMLMSHTSSLNDSQGYFSFDVINPDTNPNSDKCYNDYEPGTGYEYCNLNFNLAGSFLERLSGVRFDQYVVNNILKPLGCYGGYCVDSLDASKFVKLYEYDQNNGDYISDPDAYAPRSERVANYTMGYSTTVFSPTGGMKINAVDLAKVMMMHMNYGTSPDGVKIISEESSKNMQTPRSSDQNYGLALWINDYDIPGVNLVGHTGGAYGLRSQMFFNPEKKYGFVTITSGSKNDQVLHPLLKALYRAFIEDFEEPAVEPVAE